MPVTNGPSWIVEEKNKLEQSAWILLIELMYDVVTPATLRICRWTEPINWNSHTWTPWPISEPKTSQNTQGEMPTTDISVAGLSAFIMSVIEKNEIEGKKGNIYWVHQDHLADSTPIRTFPFTVIGATASWEVVNFTVIMSSAPFEPLQLQLPVALVTRAEFPGVPGTQITV